jgi:hypothetical protein
MTRLLIIWIVLQALWRLIRFVFGLIWEAQTNYWNGVPDNIRELARLRQMEVLNQGDMTNRWDRELYFFFLIIGWISFVIGYILSAYITIWLFELIIF